MKALVMDGTPAEIADLTTRLGLVSLTMPNDGGLSQPRPMGMPQEVVTGDEEPYSYPLNFRQAEMLVKGIDTGTASVLKRIAENYRTEEGGYGEISWPEAKTLSGARNYNHFARGHLSGLTRRLRKITGDSKADLMISYGDWLWDDATQDHTGGLLFIDGPAILALRKYFKLI
jgi:hypothetical protein